MDEVARAVLLVEAVRAEHDALAVEDAGHALAVDLHRLGKADKGTQQDVQPALISEQPLLPVQEPRSPAEVQPDGQPR